MLHMKNVLFLLLGLAASGQAKSSCSTDSDCLSNEVCARPIGSNVDYCLPVSMPEDVPGSYLGSPCVNDRDCFPYLSCGSSKTCEFNRRRRLKQVELEQELEQDNAFHRRLKQKCDPISLCDGGVIFG